jgi:hypothetical protein
MKTEYQRIVIRWKHLKKKFKLSWTYQLGEKGETFNFFSKF